MLQSKFFVKSMLAVSMLFLFCNSGAEAQNVPLKRSHAISDLQTISRSDLNATGTLNVVAVMVEFQPDTNRLTSGTGIFGSDGMEGLPYLRRAEDFRIEPLPHDRSYFEAHLEFAKNYYEKASDGKLTLNYRVLPDIYRLPEKMEQYSPTGETFTNEKIATLIKNAWNEVADGSGFDDSGLDPQNTAFVIFHAGVGRDIELTGTNLDITPLDIPSLYLSKQNLAELLEEPGFDGFEVNNGSFRVTNSMVIPRTESRRGLDIQENEFVFPLSINGLLIASIGSHLGLPDLFNTETGDPAIGRFGLMDGAGFFAYNGLLPPEPSAWEKVYLGWETPFEITEKTSGDIQLPAGSLSEQNSIARYSLSNSEYFLIENRHRDPDGNGTTITIRKSDGTEVQQTFTNQNEAFVFQEADFDTLLESGTFVDATNFDFSLPGGLDVGENENDPEDDRFLNGGILIWHIDEGVINQQLSSGRVNADPQRRGVDLEEADGAQDIGIPLAGALDNSAAFGTAFDFWWSGNDYRVILQSGNEVSFYENRFAPDTRPNNNSNSGALSFFELYDFSDNLPTASFKIKASESENAIFEQVSSASSPADSVYFTNGLKYWDYYPLSLRVSDALDDTLLIIPRKDAIQVSDYDTLGFTGVITFGRYASQPLQISPEYLVYSNLENRTVGYRAYSPATLNWPGWMVNTPLTDGFLSSQDGAIVDLDFSDTSIDGSNGTVIPNNSGFEFRSEIVNEKFAGINGNEVTFVGEDIPNYSSDAENRLFAGTIKTDGDNWYYLFEDGAFTLVNPTLNDPFVTIFEEEKAEWPAIFGHGSIYRVSRSTNQVIGYNTNGAILENTPIDAPQGIQFIGTPLVADITGDNIQDILVVGQDEYSVNVFAYESNGEPIEGFPLYVGGSQGKEVQPIHPAFFGNILYAISHKGELKSWRFSNFTSSEWPTRYGKNPYNKVSAEIKVGGTQENEFSVLNSSETYNWPNPATDHTNIRFELEQPGGTVEITVITMSGKVIFKDTINSPGGAPQEISINTQNWASGGYVARVKATVEGRSETKLIKIGVLK